MKKLFLIFAFLVPACCFSQTIDSVHVTIGSSASTVYISGMMPQMELAGVTILPLGDANNTQVINLHFKGCSVTQIVLPYDTVVEIQAPFPFALDINSFHDTSAGCPYPYAPLLIDTLYLSSSGILGVSEQPDADKSVHLFPNPAGGIVEVSAGFMVDTVSIYSAEGKKLSEHAVGKGKFSLDLTGFPGGPYFLVLGTSSGRLITKKIIKKE